MYVGLNLKTKPNIRIVSAKIYKNKIVRNVHVDYIISTAKWMHMIILSLLFCFFYFQSPTSCRRTNCELIAALFVCIVFLPTHQNRYGTKTGSGIYWRQAPFFSVTINRKDTMDMNLWKLIINNLNVCCVGALIWGRHIGAPKWILL